MSENALPGDVTIHDDPAERAYLIEFGDVRAGKAEYRMMSGRRVFTHTEVDEEYSGMGLASQVARFALDDMRDQGIPVVPLCPFFAAYITLPVVLLVWFMVRRIRARIAHREAGQDHG